jgi:hypothetical protein
LNEIAGVKLFSLQKGFGIEQLQDLGEQSPIVDLATDADQAVGAFMDTAAIMANLDLVVTSDTAIAHLAGALGVPVWLALSKIPDWRWMLSGEESPWYPSMRLFRQATAGDWKTVFERMANELSRLAVNRVSA